MKTERIPKEKHWFEVISPYDYYQPLMNSTMHLVSLSALVELVLLGKSVPAYRRHLSVNKVYPISKSLLSALLKSPTCSPEKKEAILEISEPVILERRLWESVSTSTECIRLYYKLYWEPIEKVNHLP